MSTTFDTAALIKRVYDDRKKSVLGRNDIVQALFPYDGTHLPGDELREHVWYTHIHGATLAGTQAAPTLRQPRAAKGVQPAIRGRQIYHRAKMGTLAKFQTLRTEQAFERAVTAEKRQLDMALGLYIEILSLYGRHEWGLGYITAVDNGAKTVTISAASWAPGMLGQLVNAAVDICTPTVTNNVVTALAATNGVDLQILKIEDTSTTRKIYFKNPNEDTGAVPNLAGVGAGDIVVFNTALTAAALQECVGLLPIFQQTTGTNHAGIDISTVYQMQPSAYDCGGDPLDTGKLLTAMNLVIPKGGSGTFYALVPTPVHTSLDKAMMSYRRLDQSYDKASFVNGVRGITIESQAGTLVITPHPYMPDGKALILPAKQMPPMEEGQEAPDLSGMNIRRIGEVDRAYAYPGGTTMEVAILADTAADERRAVSIQAPMVSAAGHGVCITNFALTRWT